jgi:hypothetical protein
VKIDGTPISSIEEAKKLAEDEDYARFGRAIFRDATGGGPWW